MSKVAAIPPIIALLFSVSATASDKDVEAYEAMTDCFAETAASLADTTTPLEDLAEVVIGMCWEKVAEHRRRWTDDWGTAWAGFVGPYFTMHVSAKAKEAVYLHRRQAAASAR